MNNKKVAKELLTIAKSLSAVGMNHGDLILMILKVKKDMGNVVHSLETIVRNPSEELDNRMFDRVEDIYKSAKELEEYLNGLVADMKNAQR